MILHDTFVFLHLPKCAGTFIESNLEKYVLGTRRKAGHRGVSKDIICDRKVYGCIRNPFDYYVSEWKYENGGPWHDYRGLNGDMSVFKDKFSTENFKKWLFDIHTEKILPDTTTGITACPSYKVLDIGFFTWRYLKLFCQGDVSYLKENANKDFWDATWMKKETVEKDFLKYFHVDLKMNSKMNTTPITKHFMEYYDDESKSLIFYKDRIIFDRFYSHLK